MNTVITATMIRPFLKKTDCQNFVTDAIIVSLQQRTLFLIARDEEQNRKKKQEIGLFSSSSALFTKHKSYYSSCNSRHPTSRAAAIFRNRSVFVSSRQNYHGDHHKINSFSSSSFGKDSSVSKATTPPTLTTNDTDNNHHPSTSKPIDFQVAVKIRGEESHTATIELRPGEVLRAEAGAMLYMTEGIVMDTKLEGISSAFSRMLTGQNVFLTDFRYEPSELSASPSSSLSSCGTVGLGTDFPSKILRFSLEDFPQKTLICQRGAYLASNPTVIIEMEFTKSFTSGFFGGQGFILQKLKGSGDVLVKGGGTVVRKELDPNETLRVTSGSIIAFESSIHYDVQMMPGIKNAMFGGEGLFITTLTGPGSVWLQGMPADRMVAEISRRIPSGSPGIGIPIGIGGSGGVGAEGDGVADVGDDNSSSTEGESSEVIAETDAAIDADSQATAATSRVSSDYDEVDSESPSALFGDALPADAAGSPTTTTTTTTGESMDRNMEMEEFDDDIMFDSGPSEDIKDGELFDDSTTTDSFDSDSSDEGSGIMSVLWDLFGGGDE